MRAYIARRFIVALQRSSASVTETPFAVIWDKEATLVRRARTEQIIKNVPVQRTSRNARSLGSAASGAFSERARGFPKSQGTSPEDFDGRVPAMVKHSHSCRWQQGVHV
jgi:hypothetical protein